MSFTANCHTTHIHDGTEDCRKCTDPNCPSKLGSDFLPIFSEVPSYVANDKRWSDAILASELGIPLKGPQEQEWVQGARDFGLLPKVNERPAPGVPTTALGYSSLVANTEDEIIQLQIRRGYAEQELREVQTRLRNSEQGFNEDDVLPLPTMNDEYAPPFQSTGQKLSFGESHPQSDDRDDDYRKKRNAKVLEGKSYPML